MGGPRRCCSMLPICLLLLLMIEDGNGFSPLEPPSLLFSPYSREAGRRSFGSSFREPHTQLFGVLSRSTILKHSGSSGSSSSSKNKKKNQGGSTVSRPRGITGSSKRNSRIPAKSDLQQSITRTFLLDALEEAMYRQTVALECLEAERGKLMEKLEAAAECEEYPTMSLRTKDVGDRDITTTSSRNDDTKDAYNLETNPETGQTKKKQRDPRIALDRVNARKLELRQKIKQLEELQRDLIAMGGRSNNNNEISPPPSVSTLERRFRAITGSIGTSCPILDRPKDTWKSVLANRPEAEFGRPRGFQGLVFYSPLGVPILVGKTRAESDGVLRRAAQGSDLWFQVEDYEGSRVLLRSSLVRGTKDSKKCFQMAADLAAYYSIWGTTVARSSRATNDGFETVPVMYTDSKHVAKRGTRAGRMRKRKSLGRVMGRPSSVEAIARGKIPS